LLANAVRLLVVEAISKYEQAVRIREQLNSSAPLDLSIRRDLAEAWIKLGDALQLAHKNVQALEYYQKSLETLESLSVSIPADAGVRRMLQEVNSKQGKGNLALTSNRQ